MAGEFQGDHAGKGGAPAQQPLDVEAGGGGQPLGAGLDCLQVVGLPAEQVDRVERRVAETGCGVDGDQPALGPPSRRLLGVRSPWSRTIGEASWASRVASRRPRS